MKYITLFFIILLTSCAHKNVEVENKIDPTTSFIINGEGGANINWWESFDDDELSELVKQGLQDNLSLKANDLRLKSTAVDAKIAGAELYPTLNLSSSAATDFDDFGKVENASLSFSSSWELDVWGQIDANINKAQWSYEEQFAAYRARANLVAGGITNAWLGLISEQEKKLVLAQQYQRTKVALSVISRRFEMGKNSITNIWQQQKLLKSIEVQQSKNLADLFLYQQTLALWLAIPTNKVDLSSEQALPKLPDLPALGLPAEALKHRPDIEQAFAKIKAADENLSIAISNQYPRISLRANYSTSQTSISDLFDDWSGNLLASLALPLIDGGVRKSIVEQRKLQLQALVFDYQEVWLEAIASVNQVLTNEAQLLKIRKNLQEQLELAQRTEKLTALKYLNGKTSYLNLLRAQESILSLERQKIDANKQVIINRVLLYRELSHGDFSMDKQPNINPSNLVENNNQGKET